jgi:hypothetical protein
MLPSLSAVYVPFISPKGFWAREKRRHSDGAAAFRQSQTSPHDFQAPRLPQLFKF